MREIRVCATTLAIVCCLCGAGPRASEDASIPDSAAPIVRRLSPGEVHRYNLPLAAAEFARVVVEQQGIDLVVQVRDADEQEIEQVQEEIRSRGEERVDVVAER